jgi:hypothetical protein
MSDSTQDQIEQQDPNPTRLDAPSPSPAPQNPMTPAQAALARAQAARAAHMTHPSTGEGESAVKTATARQNAPEDIDEIIEAVLDDLESLDYLTFAFVAGEESERRIILSGRGPTLDVAVRLAVHVLFNIDVKGRRLYCFGGPERKMPDEVTQQKTIETVQKCIERLQKHDEITFILAWYAEGTARARLDRVGYTFQEAMTGIGNYLAEAVRADLCF